MQFGKEVGMKFLELDNQCDFVDKKGVNIHSFVPVGQFSVSSKPRVIRSFLLEEFLKMTPKWSKVSKFSNFL